MLGRLEESSARPQIIGISAPQGAGKSTLTKNLCQMAAEQGLRAVTLSIDDFYLTRAEQLQLAAKNPDNPYLQQRGYPGTHDLALGEATLEALKAGQAVALPVYDKSAHSGQGDRKPPEEWGTHEGRADLVFLEGWMLGFHPLLSLSDPHLREINRRLAGYDRWLRHLDAFVWLEPENPRFVLKWRVEAEERMKAEGRSGMSREEIEAYIAKFLPAYENYLSTVRGPGSNLHILIGENRLPLRDF